MLPHWHENMILTWKPMHHQLIMSEQFFWLCISLKEKNQFLDGYFIIFIWEFAELRLPAVLSTASLNSAECLQQYGRISSKYLSKADTTCGDYNDSIQRSNFYLSCTAASVSGLTGVCHHLYSDRVKWDLRDWVLRSDEITVFMCAGFQTEWLSDRACKFPQVSLLSLSLTLSPSLTDVMVGITVAGSPQQHESCKSCARSQRNNTVTLSAAATITLLPLTAGTDTVQPWAYQLLDNTQPQVISELDS